MPHNQNLIFPDKQLVLCLTPKVASTAIIHALLKFYGMQGERPYHEASGLNWKSSDTVSKYLADYSRAQFVRNPFDRAAAVYDFKIKRQGCIYGPFVRAGMTAETTFSEFVDIVAADPNFDSHTHIQAEMIDGRNFLGRFETMADDWATFCAIYGLNIGPLPRVNDGGSGNYKSLYTDREIEIVSEVYRKDMEEFGYEWSD